MRKRFFHGLVLVLSISLMSAMCSSDDDGSQINNSSEIAEIETIAESGTWIITSFIDSGQDETNDFNGYNFTFNTGGSLVATNGSITMEGTWSITDDSDDDSNSNDDIDFNIFFSVPDTNDFEDLNDDWDIVSASTTRIELIDISGGNGDTDTITFEKN